MANTKKQGNGSLIFIWVLIILLAAGTFGVIHYYTSNHSTLIANDELAVSLAESFDKSIGSITSDDLGTIEGLTFYQDLSYMEGVPAMTGVEFYLNGYRDAYDAYYAEDVTEEQKAALTDPNTLVGYAELTDKDITEDLRLFTGLKTLSLYNYGETNSDVDMLKIAAESFTSLEELTVYGYATADFSVVSNLSGLTSLSFVSESAIDTAALANLTKLETLALSGTGINDISSVAKLTSLETLSISGTEVSDVSAVAGLTNLKVLDLSNNMITDISALSALNNETIEEVYLTGNLITDYTPIKHLDAEKVFTDEEEAVEETSETDAESEVDENSLETLE